MASSAAQIRNWSGPAILGYGFRPFFLSAAVFAAFAMVAWIGALTGAWQLPTSLGPVEWHAHEFLWGYLPAVVAGFMLTAVPNWTGRLPIVGWPLAALWASWLLGRVAVFVSAGLPPLAVVAFTGSRTLASLMPASPRTAPSSSVGSGSPAAVGPGRAVHASQTAAHRHARQPASQPAWRPGQRWQRVARKQTDLIGHRQPARQASRLHSLPTPEGQGPPAAPCQHAIWCRPPTAGTTCRSAAPPPSRRRWRQTARPHQCPGPAARCRDSLCSGGAGSVAKGAVRSRFRPCGSPPACRQQPACLRHAVP